MNAYLPLQQLYFFALIVTSNGAGAATAKK